MDNQGPAKKRVTVRYDELSFATRPVRRRNWKPFANRPTFLVSVIFTLLLLVAGLEIVIRKAVPWSLNDPNHDLTKRSPQSQATSATVAHTTTAAPAATTQATTKAAQTTAAPAATTVKTTAAPAITTTVKTTVAPAVTTYATTTPKTTVAPAVTTYATTTPKTTVAPAVTTYATTTPKTTVAPAVTTYATTTVKTTVAPAVTTYVTTTLPPTTVAPAVTTHTTATPQSSEAPVVTVTATSAYINPGTFTTSKTPTSVYATTEVKTTVSSVYIVPGTITTVNIIQPTTTLKATYLSPDSSTNPPTTPVQSSCVTLTATQKSIVTITTVRGAKRDVATSHIIRYITPVVFMPAVHDQVRRADGGCTYTMTVTAVGTSYLYLDASTNAKSTTNAPTAAVPTTSQNSYTVPATTPTTAPSPPPTTVATTPIIPTTTKGTYINPDTSTTAAAHTTVTTSPAVLTGTATQNSYISIGTSTNSGFTTTTPKATYISIGSSTNSGLTSAQAQSSYVSASTSTLATDHTVVTTGAGTSYTQISGSYLSVDTSTLASAHIITTSSGLIIGFGTTATTLATYLTSTASGDYISLGTSTVAYVSGSSVATSSVPYLASPSSYINTDTSTNAKGIGVTSGSSYAQSQGSTPVVVITSATTAPYSVNSINSEVTSTGTHTNSVTSSTQMPYIPLFGTLSTSSTGATNPFKNPTSAVTSSATEASTSSHQMSSNAGSSGSHSVGGSKTSSGATGKTGTQSYSTSFAFAVAASTSSAASASATDQPAPNPVQNLLRTNYKVNITMPPHRYYAILFLPSVLAISVQETWYMVAANVKMMEPFRLLAQPEGATVKESLLADYLSAPTSWSSLISATRGNGSMIVIIIVSFIVTFLAPLSTSAMSIVSAYTYIDEEGNRQRNHPTWVISIFFMRLLQATLVLVAVMLAVLAVVVWRRRSGVSANPSKIATMAALLNHPSMVQDLRSIDPNAADKEIEQSLIHNRYRIADYEDSEGNRRCGVVKVGEATPDGLHAIPAEDFSVPQSVPRSRINRIQHQSVAQSAYDACFMILMFGLLSVLVAYWKSGGPTGFNNFFNSQRFEPRFILSLTAALGTIALQNVEREVRLMTPYRMLAQRRVSARHSVLRSVNGTALSSLYRSVRHGNWYHLFIAITTLLGDILIITVAGVPYNGGETWLWFLVCFWMSVTIIALMIIAYSTVFIWRQQNRRMLIPVQPNSTLIRTWMSLCNKDNRLRKMLEDSGDKSNKDIRLRFRRTVGQFWGGWIKDEHNREMYSIDKEYYHDPAGYY